MMHFVRLLAACAALAACVPAQRTWIVDWRQGPGTNFTDIPPAVAAAAAGDLILVVRGGTYTAPTITKGIAIVPKWGWGVAVWGTLTVRDLLANERCLLKNISGVSISGVSGDFVFADNAGSVHLEFSGGNFGSGVGLDIRNCQQVTMTRSGAEFVKIDSSNVVFSECAFSRSTAPHPFAVSATNSKVIFANTSASGTPGSIAAIGCAVLVPPGPALVTTNSDILLAGSSRLTGGSTNAGLPPCLPFSAPAIIANGGTLTYDDVGGVPFNRLKGPIQTTVHSTPVVAATVNGPGLFDLWMFGPPDGALALLASLPRTGSPVYLGPSPGWPGLWIDDLAFLIVSVETIPTGRVIRRQMPHFIPQQLYNIPVTFQAVTLSTAGGLELSTASTVIMN